MYFLDHYYDTVQKYVLRKKFVISGVQDAFIHAVANEVEEYISRHSFRSKTKLLYIPSYYMIYYPRIIDMSLALALKIRGVDITSVITGFFYKEEDVIYGGVYNGNRNKNLTDYNSLEIMIWKDVLKTNCIYLEDYRTEQDIKMGKAISKNITIANYEKLFYKGYAIGEQAAMVTQNMNNMPELISQQSIFRQLKIHTANIVELMNAYERLIDEVNPDVIYSEAPFYYRWGVPYHVARRRNIPFYSSIMSEKKNSLVFQNNSNKLLDCSAAWSSFKKSTVCSDKGITCRKQGKVAYYSPFPKPDTTQEEFQKLLGHLDRSKPIVFFPVNVVFDAAVFRKSKSFRNIIEMLKKVINFFNNHKEYQLIIKAHPVEEIFYKKAFHKKIRSCKYCLANILDVLVKKLPSNIFFIDYNSKISTYDIINIIDLGIVYTSTTAIEMAWIGKPVIAVAESHLQHKGFTYLPKNQKDFFYSIKRILRKKENMTISHKRIELSKKYYALFHDHACVDLKLFQGNDKGGVEDKFLFKNYSDLLPGRSKSLDYVCDAIVNNLTIYGENRWPPAT